MIIYYLFITNNIFFKFSVVLFYRRFLRFPRFLMLRVPLLIILCAFSASLRVREK